MPSLHRGHLTQRPRLALDVSNMHGSMCLSNILRSKLGIGCRENVAAPRRHVYKGTAGEMHLIEAVMGVDQGCRSASYLALGWPLCMNPCASTVAALQDDTYLLSSPEFFKGMLLKRLLLPSPFAGCQTCASPRRWPPVGSAGISIVAQPPLVLKQPLI